MRFEVPQFIEVEDKIVGPFTWKQFVYLAGGAGMLIILKLLLPFFIFLLLALPVMGLAGFLAFYRINNRPFSAFLESFAHFVTKDRLYLWRKQEQQTITGKERPVVSFYDYEDPLPPVDAKKGSLAALSRKLELNTLNKK